MEVPITEQSNSITNNIDVAQPEDIIQLLKTCDDEIFNGWRGSQGVFGADTLSALEDLAGIAAEYLQPRHKIIMSGCGTSGRLGFIIARNFNEILSQKNLENQIDYLIAGHDIALFTSQEAPEDNPEIGRQMLEQSSKDCDRVLYIGITCGLSAPYVAGQLDYCMNNPDRFLPVLLGFNPVTLARKIPIENWDKTFFQVASRLESLCVSKQGFIINPIIGPEPITGSSRMKSGTATKILLEAMLASVLQKATSSPPVSIGSLLEAYRVVHKALYQQQEVISKLADIIQLAGTSLQNSGHVHYVSWNHLGIIGMLDASECPPTFGATLEDIRGFYLDGFVSLKNKQGDLSDKVRITVKDFETEKIPQLTKKDIVIFLCEDCDIKMSTEVIKTFPCKVVVINIVTNGNQKSIPEIFGQPELWLDVELPWQQLMTLTSRDWVSVGGAMYAELSVKWLCNAISTGAHILKGKVYHNFMVDVKTSNNKLFHRAVGIIERFGQCTMQTATQCLLKAIYRIDQITPEIMHAPISQHITKATHMDKVVPMAIIMALNSGTVANADKILTVSPVIRTALAQHAQKL